MKTMPVRGIDPSLAEKMKHTARQEGKSVNQLVIETIRERFGDTRRKRFTVVHHDMDHLFGQWSQAEFESIQGKIEAERRVDEELWR